MDHAVPAAEVGESGGGKWPCPAAAVARSASNVTLNFALYTISYVPQDNDGSALPEVGPIGWNIQTNEPI